MRKCALSKFRNEFWNNEGNLDIQTFAQKTSFLSIKSSMKNAIFWNVCRVGLVGTDVSEERITYVNMVTGIGELGTTLVGTSNRSMMRRNTIRGVSIISRATRCNIPEDSFFIVIPVKTWNLTYHIVYLEIFDIWTVTHYTNNWI
jgi:hypothetical protein